MLEAFKLSIPDVPPSYEGNLYFILGPGLGDTVNDFRLLHEVLLQYPHAKPIVYADPRWKSLYVLLPEMPRCDWRYHVAAPSGELVAKKKEQSYSETFRGVMREIQIELKASSGFVAIGGFTCLDQLARKELGLATKARSIGLQLSKEQCRPFLPLPVSVMKEAQQFLLSQGLPSGHYVAIAPQTWADKAWEPSCWQNLTQKLNLPILVLGVSGCATLGGPGVYQALDLPLPLVAALIAHAQCFVGLDSGLTHVAACFDVPLIGLQAQGKFPPFLVEPHSPFRRIHLTPFVYGTALIPAESVQTLVKEALHVSSPPLCPLCEEIPYVLGSHEDKSAYLCRCGLLFRFTHGQEDGAIPFQMGGEEAMLPITIQGLILLKKQLQLDKNWQSSDQPDTLLTYSFEHWISRETSFDTMLLDRTNRELWWSWDAVAHLFTVLGWHMVRSQGRLGAEGEGPLHSFTITVSPKESDCHDVLLEVPWGKELVWLKRSLYDRWLRWESFGRPNELEDLGWRLVKEGYERDGRDILRFAAKREWRGRTLGRLLRSEWKALGSGMKNSQDILSHV